MKLNKNPGKGPRELETVGAVDLHFHGAFGIDLMSASPKQLNELSGELWKSGLAGFCATTVTAAPKDLKETVVRLGQWIRSDQFPGAKPFGIHLEGPWIAPQMSGAHPTPLVRQFNPDELEILWKASQGTLKIITLAPEAMSTLKLRQLIKWCNPRGILLSAGHSKATFEQAKKAFELGIRGVTHAWNALAYHHREPGVLGAALGNREIYLELIMDQIHVSRPWIRLTRALHPSHSVCLISDCAAAAGQPKNPQWSTLGRLKVHFQAGASRTSTGMLAGGGLLLPESYCRWAEAEARDVNRPIQEILLRSVHQLTRVPARILGLKPRQLADRKVVWEIRGERKLRVIPIDSRSSAR